MDPSKIRNYGGTSTFKPNKLAYLPPGALAIRGRGKSLQSLCSVRIWAEKRNPITKSLNFNASTSSQNEPVQNSVVAPRGIDPIENNVPYSPEVEVMQDTQINEISAHEFEKGKKVRGTNICKNVARLKLGEKLHITFYQNRVVGENYASFVRHLGILVRDRNMCPLRVHTWADIKEDQLEHMWDVVTDKFTNDDMNVQKEHVLQHMRRLWNNWRGSLHKNMKSKPFCDALKDVPRGVDKSDWEWLVKEHFLSENFKGGKDGKPPNMDTIFFETRKKDNKLVEPETNAKYVEIQKLVQSDSSITNIEVVEKCFRPQCKSHVVGFGGGIMAKELKGWSSSKAALLENKCGRMDELEIKYEQLARVVLGQPSTPASSSDQ